MLSGVVLSRLFAVVLPDVKESCVWRLCLEAVQMKSCRDFRRFVLSGMFGFCEKMFARDFLETSVFSSVGKLSKTRKLKREVKRQ